MFLFSYICSFTFRIWETATTDEFTTSTLSITRIRYRMYGNYTCKAMNKLGNAQETIHLYGKYSFLRHILHSLYN